jgi:hypothetical protein
MPFKALFFPNSRPYEDMGDLIQIARAEACKILHVDKVQILNILPCYYPSGYVVVVQNSGGKRENRKLK